MSQRASKATRTIGTREQERGSALILAILVIVILMLLGLAFMLTGETESKIARNQRDASQAGFVAEGAVRMVKRWFDVPAGARAHLVPTASQVDRSLRWVDDDGDGTYEPYATAAAPFNVVYRQGTDDLFEKPYRGSPALALMGTEDHPDIRISETGSGDEQTFLATLNAGLYPDFPAVETRARVRQLDVYAPPVIIAGGQRTRFGIATVKVIADIYQYAGTASETRIATRIVKAVLNEMPYRGPGGPLQSCVDIQATGEFGAHWGVVTAVGLLNLNPNPDLKVESSVPFWDGAFDRIIARDMDQDGSVVTGSPGSPTPDDRDGDGTPDFDDWLASTNVEDPWIKFWSEGDVQTNSSPFSPGCSTASCQPAPFWRANTTPPPAEVLHLPADIDHSNIVKNVARGLCPDYPYQFWKDVSLSGSENVYYYKSNGPGTATYKLFGQGPSVTVETAIHAKNGIFFFDTATNSEPVDGNSDGTYDNLADDVIWSGQGVAAGGFVYMNANLRTSGSGNIDPSLRKTLVPPGEPFVDTNGNQRYDDDEWFVDLDYPGALGGTYNQQGMYRNADGGVQRQDPTEDGSAGWPNQQINIYGVLYTNGMYDAQGNWMFYGSVVTKSGMTQGAGTPQFYWDERITKDEWPPLDLGLPRTIISSWQTEL